MFKKKTVLFPFEHSLIRDRAKRCFSFCFPFCFSFCGPGGDFGGLRSRSESSGMPPPRLRHQNHPQEHQHRHQDHQNRPSESQSPGPIHNHFQRHSNIPCYPSRLYAQRALKAHHGSGSRA